MIAGTLELQMMANLARLSKDMGTAKTMVSNAVSSMQKVLGAIGVGFSAHLLVAKINEVTEGLEKLKDASEKTGASVEELDKLKFLAGISGSSLEGVTGALVKLSKSMVEAEKDGGKAAQALKFLGLSAKDSTGNLKDPAVLYGEIAKELFKFQDGAGKAAIAIALMGKAGAEQLPTMKQMMQMGELTTTVTKEQTEAAERYNDQLALLNRQKEVVWKTITTALLPSLISLLEVFFNTSKQAESLGGMMKKLAADGSIEAWADKGAMAVAVLVDALKVIPQILSAIASSFEVVWADIKVMGEAAQITPLSLLVGKSPLADLRAEVDKRNKVLAEANAKYEKLLTGEVNATQKAMSAMIAARKDRAAKEAIFGAPGSGQGNKTLNFAVGDPAKAAKAANAYLEYLKGVAANELSVSKDVAAHKQVMLDLMYQNHKKSDQEYFTEKLAIAKNAADLELKTLNELSAAQEAALSKTKRGTAEYWKALKDVEETEAKRAKVTREFGQLTEVAFEQARKAADNYQRGIEQVNIQIMQLTGETAKAAAAQFELQNRDERARSVAAGDAAGVAARDRLGALTAAQAEFNQERDKLSAVNARLQLQEERVQNTFRTGAISELEAMGRTGDARVEAAKQQEVIIVNLNRIAVASGNPALVLQAEQATVALEKLRTETDLLGDKINGVFVSSAADAWADFKSGAKTAEEAFKSFSDSVVKQIDRMVMEALSKKLFSAMGMSDSGGGAGGIGGFLSSLFGGGGGAGASAAGGVDFASLFASGVMPMARGGDFMVNRPTLFLAGEAGPERATFSGANAGGKQQNLTVQNFFHITGPVDKRSQAQIAVAAGEGVQREMARNS